MRLPGARGDRSQHQPFGLAAMGYGGEMGYISLTEITTLGGNWIFTGLRHWRK